MATQCHLNLTKIIKFDLNSNMLRKEDFYNPQLLNYEILICFLFIVGTNKHDDPFIHPNEIIGYSYKWKTKHIKPFSTVKNNL